MPTISPGTAHKLPPDLHQALSTSKSALTAWEKITPLARNEWICWVESVKKPETRIEHIMRTISELKEGIRRPCCWMGCPHRTDKPMNASQKFVLSRQNKKKI